MPKDTDLTPRIRPLVTAAEMFPKLETLCLQAREEILMSFRIFDPQTRCRSAAAAELGLATWGELLAHVAARGVKLRLLIADFDPVFTPDLHRNAWEAGTGFGRRLMARAGEGDAPFLGAEVLVAQHEARSAPFWQTIFSSRIRRALEGLKARSPGRLTALQLQALNGRISLRPATLHQKFAVVDGQKAIIGGIDIDERRWDDEDHDRRAEETWHDVSVAVAGAVAGDMRRHFAECWDRAIDSDAACFAAEPTPVSTTGPLPAKLHSALGPRLLRTLSQGRRSALAIGPAADVTEHEEAHLAAFDSAERFIYIETQFFRHLPLARALARAARRAPDLNCVLILPTEPERVIFDGADGIDARHEQALQMRCLGHLRRAFGDRLAVLAPSQPRPAPRHTQKPLNGAGVVYLHSKVTLVDDTLGIIGSANLNGRSMRWDTEASLQFQDARQVQAVRDRLAQSWLRGARTGIDIHRAADWMQLARFEAALPPEQRQTFLQPWPEARNRRFARYVPILPSEMF